MGTPGDLLLTLAGVLVVVAAPLEIAFGALVVVWLLVPGELSVPHAPHLLLVTRVVLWALAARLIVRHGPREPNAAAYRPTPVHAALGALVVVGFIDGVAVAPSTDSLASDLHAWVAVLDLLVLFVVVLAIIRTISPRRALGIVVGVLAVATAVGFFERLFFHAGWSHFFFERLPARYLAPGADALAKRGGHVRSQGAGQFALEYGWVLTMLLPLSVFAAMRWSRRAPWARVILLLPLCVAAAVILSGSRGPEVALVAAVPVFVLAAGADRRLLKWGVAAVGLGVVVALANPSFVTSAFSKGIDPASVRLNRLPLLFDLVVHRPFTGLGFNGIAFVFGGLDDGYAKVYATLGVLGVLAWLTVILTALVVAARALRARAGTDTRALGAASFVGIIVVAVAASNYDLTNSPQSSWALVFLAALGAAAAQRAPRRAPAPRRWARRSLLPLIGAAVGTIVLVAAPISASQSLSVLTVAPWVATSEGSGAATDLVDTLCASVTNPDVIAPGTSVRCLQGSTVFPTDYPGLALLTVRGPNPAAVHEELVRAFTPLYRRMPIEGGLTGTVHSGKPSWALTAPLSGAVVGLWAMFLLPPSRRRRPQGRDPERAPDDPHGTSHPLGRSSPVVRRDAPIPLRAGHRGERS